LKGLKHKVRKINKFLKKELKHKG